LATAGISRAVISNGDGTDPSTPDTRSSPWRTRRSRRADDERRQGPPRSVDDGLLRQDSAAPFGVRLDPTGSSARSATRGQPGSVVLVEGSDSCGPTSRLDSRPTSQAVKLRARALEATDPHRRSTPRPTSSRAIW